MPVRAAASTAPTSAWPIFTPSRLDYLLYGDAGLTLARAFVQSGWTAVRFNFRGVGASAGVHDEGRGEAQDMQALVEPFLA